MLWYGRLRSGLKVSIAGGVEVACRSWIVRAGGLGSLGCIPEPAWLHEDVTLHEAKGRTGRLVSPGVFLGIRGTLVHYVQSLHISEVDMHQGEDEPT